MSKDSAYFFLKSIDGKHDVKELKRELDTLHGVISVSCNAIENTVAVDYDSSGVNFNQIEKKISNLGYEIEADKIDKHIM